MAVGGAEERLDGAVGRRRLVLDRQRREGNALGEPRAQRQREVRHLVIAAGAASRPLPYLPGAEGRLSRVGKRAFEQREVHAATVALRPERQAEAKRRASGLELSLQVTRRPYRSGGTVARPHDRVFLGSRYTFPE